MPISTVTTGLALRLWNQSGLVSAPLGSEDGDVVAHSLVRHGVDPLLAGLGAARVEEEHVRAFERSSDLALVGAELVDDLGVPVVHFTHSVRNLIASTTISADRPPTTDDLRDLTRNAGIVTRPS
jgi:hypothetical protein